MRLLLTVSLLAGSFVLFSSDSNAQPKTPKPSIHTAYDFVAGDSVIFTDGFKKGIAPARIKTNGSAQVVTIDNDNGNWLALENGASYKLAKQIFYPKHFTVEFDLFALGDQIKDIEPVYFGFAKDNSVKEYLMSVGAYTQIQYYNEDEVVVGNSELKIYLSTHFDFRNYLNRRMHVAVDVNGETARIYLDQTQIANTALFGPSDLKNLFVSAPMHYSNGSKVLLGNIKVAVFK